MHQVVEPPKPENGGPAISRRVLLEGSASAGLVAAAAGCAVFSPCNANAAGPEPRGPSERQTAAFRVRQTAAQSYLKEPEPSHQSNGDEARYPDKRASFAKTLPHDDAGEVDADAFATFVSILSGADPDRFEMIPRDRRAEVYLNDPQATYAFELAGLDGSGTTLDPPQLFPAPSWQPRWQRSTGFR
jgi:hypothetical protein